jgi:uncharacterized membrane protein
MKALAQLPADQGATAMQRINDVVLSPLFLGVSLGTAFLAAACVVLSVLGWGSLQSVWLLASGLLYLGGSLPDTVAFNVPRNERLAGLDPGSAQAAEYWPAYLREWSRWNHVRSVASIASAACSAGALAI